MAKLLVLAVFASLLIVAMAQDATTTDTTTDTTTTTDVSLDDLSTQSQPNSPYFCNPGNHDCSAVTFTPSQYCTGRCCLSTHQCADSSCVNVFGLPNSFNCNTGNMNCRPKISCVSSVPCSGNNQVHCFGNIVCNNGPNDCLGFTAGALCLYDGSSDNFKICTPNAASSSSTGPQSFIVGDPQFVGLRGQSFQIHGVAGEVYNIVSDADLQYNSRFVFLDQGDCPVVNGKKQKGCFAHPGSYLGELGLKTRFGDKIHYVSGSAAGGFGAVELNGKQMEIGESIMLSGDAGYVSLNNTHLSTIKVGNWQFDFENSDMFINQRVAVTNPSKLRSHGLLGQTWKTVTYPNPLKYIQGEVDDYVIRGRDVFGDEFVYNSFN